MKTATAAIRLLIMLTTVCCAGEDSNLLDDPGFENGLRAWQGNTAYPPETLEVVRNDPHYVRSGEAAIKIVQHKTDAHDKPILCAVYTQSAMPMQPLVEHTLRFWAKGEGQITAALYCYNEQGSVREPGLKATKDSEAAKDPDDDEFNHYFLKPSDSWKQCSYTVILTAPDTKVKEVRIAIYSHGDIYVDDCFFGKKETPKKKTP